MGISLRTVYNYYQEWRYGEIQRLQEVDERCKMENLDDDTKQSQLDSVFGFGAFAQHKRGSYKRQFLLEDEDLKIEFKRWVRKNIRKLNVKAVQKYLDEKLLTTVETAVLEKYDINLPISHDTAWRWLKKCNATITDNGKVYYNDQHLNPEVIEYRDKNCERDARNAYLSTTLRTAQRTARKARTYRRAYLDDSGQSHFLIEKYVRQVKCHRNILDMNCRDLQDMEKKANQDKAVDEIRKNKEEMEKEKKIILKEEEDMKQHKENRKRKREEGKMKKDKDNKKRK